jgi:hypothetical protein
VRISEWLETRTPSPPEALELRVRASLAPVLDDEMQEGGARMFDALLAAARSLLTVVIRDESGDRECAHDLLAADALVTYAFELAAGDPDAIESLSDSAMRSLGALAAEGAA